MYFENFQWVEFDQERIPLNEDSRINVFEFSSLYPHREHHYYCRLLLKKLISLNRLLISRFLEYHCKTTKDPLKWLTSLENLLEKNIDELLLMGYYMRLDQVLTILQELKAYYSSMPKKRVKRNGKGKFEIEKVKAQSKKLSSFNEKKAYLLRKKTDFLQQYTYNDKPKPPFDKQIDLELNYLKAELKLLGGEGLEDETLIWTGQIQQLVEVFFQWLHQKNEAGLPLLKGSNERVIRFIIKNFKRMDGSSLSAASIRSLLRPSRQRKNFKPKNNNQNDDN